MKKPFARQCGFMLIEVLLAISIIVSVAAYSVIEKIKEAKVGLAKEYGKKIAEYNSAVRAAVSTDGAGVIAGGSPRAGVAWLKNNDGSCPGGGSPQPFLACSYRAQTVFGIDIDAFPVASQTTIVSNGALPNPTYTATTLFPAITGSDGALDSYLTHIAFTAALNYDNYDRASTGFGTAAYTIDPVTNVITAEAVADSGADIFLRRDGTNSMSGSLNMATNDIIDAGDYNGTGDINVGGRIANPLGGAVEINDVDGLIVTGETAFIGDTTVTGNHSVSLTSDLRGPIINSTGDLTINDNLTASGRMNLTSAVATHQIANVVSVNDIELASTELNGVNATLSGTMTFSGVFQNGQRVPKPICNSANNSTPQIFVQPAVFHANGDPMYGVAAYAVSSGAEWIIRVETMNMAGTMVVTGKASAFIKCS